MNRALFIYLLIFCLMASFFVVAPKILSESQIIVAVEIISYSLFATSFNLLFRYGGMLPFGHGGLFGLGAYAIGFILTGIKGISVLLSVFLSGMTALVGGAIIGFFSLRLKGVYFALLTLAFQMFLFALAVKWRSVTGGDDGFGISRPDLYFPLFGTISLRDGSNFYFFSLITVVVSLSISYWLLQTPFGNSIRCIKDNEERAAFLGYKTFLSKLVLFCVASFMAGIAGSLFALNTQFISPEVLHIDVSLVVMMMVFIGGSQYFLGPAVGSAFYVIFQDWLSSLTDKWMLFMGVLFIVMVLYVERGLVGIFSRKESPKSFK